LLSAFQLETLLAFRVGLSAFLVVADRHSFETQTQGLAGQLGEVLLLEAYPGCGLATKAILIWELHLDGLGLLGDNIC